MTDLIYLDHNATTRPSRAVIDAMTSALRERWANPSSLHRLGVEARRAIELGRESVARLVGCDPRELVLTSGGTESAVLALRGAIGATGRPVVVTSRLEHSAVRELAATLARHQVEVIWLPADRDGVVDVEQLEDTLAGRGSEIAVVSIMAVNNETGVIQPVERIGAACAERGVLFHCDATQRVGKLPVDLRSLPCDLLTFAAHKFHGPKGVGGLFVRKGIRVAPQAVGHQEMDRRGGTENVPGIVGQGTAADEAAAWLATDGAQRQALLRDRLEGAILERIAGTAVNGAGAERIWSTSNIAFEGLEAEIMLLALSERGVYASAGAACSSGSLDPSPVLLAMGHPFERAIGSVRLSLGRETTADEIDRAVEIIFEVVRRLRG